MTTTTVNRATGYKTKKLTIGYFFSLSLIAVVILVSYTIIRASIAKQTSDATVINLSGRQRTLSQRLTIELLMAIQARSPKMKKKHIRELEETLATWTRVHIGLQKGDGGLDLPGMNTEQVVKLYAVINPYYQRIKQAVDKILQLDSIDLTQLSSDSPLVQEVVEASALFLGGMDTIVFQYDREAGDRVESLQRLETTLVIVALLLLVFVGQFIFQPLVKRVGSSYHNLQKVNLRLEEEIPQRKKAEKLQNCIYRISEAAQSVKNLDELFRTIHEIIGELMPARNFYIALYDADTELLSFPYFVDEYDETPARKKLGKGITEYVLRTGKSILATSKVFKKLVEKGEIEVIGTLPIDWLGVPLNTEERTIGLLATQSYTEGIRHTNEHKDILKFVSTQIAMAIHHKQIEESAKLQKAYFQQLFENSPQGIAILNDNDRIVNINKGFENLFQYLIDEIKGKNINDTIIPDNLIEEAAGLSHKVFIGKIVRIENVRKRKDGSLVDVSILAYPIKFDDKQIGVYAIYSDITERKIAETSLKKTMVELEKTKDRLTFALSTAQESDQLKSEFLANTSHELRTPLNSIIGFLNLIKDDLCDSPEEEKEFIINALKSSHHLLRLINDVLDIAKIESGTMEVDLTTINLQNVFDEVSLLTHIQAEEKKLNLDFFIKNDKEILILADIQKLKQVLLNLISNSLKFTKYGSIIISAKPMKKNGKVQILVEDTGVGIPVEKQKIVFNQFTQVDGSTSRKYRGTGLGLSITKSLIESMDGTIDLTSPGSGKGTKVSLTLPLIT